MPSVRYNACCTVARAQCVDLVQGHAWQVNAGYFQETCMDSPMHGFSKITLVNVLYVTLPTVLSILATSSDECSVSRYKMFWSKVGQICICN